MHKSHAYLSAALAVLLVLGGCAVAPTGPSVMVLPGSHKSFDAFRADDYACRDFAMQQIGGRSANQAAADSAVRSAAIGTLVGAAAGAAIGGRNSTGIGAGTGLLVGSMMGAGAADETGYDAQRRYDQAYVQCMYAHGHRVPVSGRMTSDPDRLTRPPSTPATAIPPPPPGYPPPPPPDAR